MQRRDIYAGLIAVGIIALLFVVNDYVGQRESRARAEQQAKASQQQIESQQKQIDQAQREMADRDREAQEQARQFQILLASVKTTQQAAQALPRVIDLPAAPREVTSADMRPDAPGILRAGDYLLPKEDVMPLFQHLATCKQEESTLAVCQGDAKSLQTQIVATAAQRDQEKARGDQWEKAARGGSRLQRIGHAMKIIGCSAAGAFLGGQRNAQGAAVGAAAGAAVCAAF